MADLKTTEKYAIAQIFVCGAITREEFKSANGFLGTVQDETIRNLCQKGLLEQTLFQEK